MQGNEYHDIKGHFTDKANDGGVCYHNTSTKENVLVEGVKKGFYLENDNEKPTQSVLRKAISKSHSPWKNDFLKAYDKGSETSKEIIDKISNGLKVKISSDGESYYSYNENLVRFTPSGLSLYAEGWYDDEDTIYHEMGHALDRTLRYAIEGKKRSGPFYSHNMVSTTYIAKNGKTLLENIKEELTPQVRERIVDDFMKEYQKTEDYKQAKVVKAKYADLSDMCEAQSGKTGFVCGHSIKDQNYWDESGNNQATEAFAELFSAKSSSNHGRYKLLKKYIPNTCKAFDEIYQKMKGI